MQILSPKPPHLNGELEAWDDQVADELEIDHLLVSGKDFAGARRISIDGSRLDTVTLVGIAIDKLELTDVSGTKLEAAALQAYKASFLRVGLTDCRLTGAEFAEGRFEDCLFRNLKLDEAGFRFAHFKRVRFENCVMRQTDFSSAKFDHVIFSDCDLEGANFVSASCQRVDITGEDLAGVRGLLGLRGATISSTQLIQLAPLLASELGFHVKD